MTRTKIYLESLSIRLLFKVHLLSTMLLLLQDQSRNLIKYTHTDCFFGDFAHWVVKVEAIEITSDLQYLYKHLMLVL